MSHTTTIKSVPIRSVNALRAAVQELKGKGIKCDLVENEVPRMYYANQHGKCAFVLKLHDSQYDVGFDQQKDGTYAPVLDIWNQQIAKQVGTTLLDWSTTRAKDTAEQRAMRKDHQSHIGQLLQGYSKHAAIQTATSKGYMVQSCTVGADMQVHIKLSVN